VLARWLLATGRFPEYRLAIELAQELREDAEQELDVEL
jgi:hypothetical protein